MKQKLPQGLRQLAKSEQLSNKEIKELQEVAAMNQCEPQNKDDWDRLWTIAEEDIRG